MHDIDEYAYSFSSLMKEVGRRISKSWQWLKHRVGHKLSHLRPNYLLDVLTKHGFALVIIIVVWELIEDVGFPLLFLWLGKHVHPAFLVGAPASWLLCLHWLVVPLTWSVWMKIKKRRR